MIKQYEPKIDRISLAKEIEEYVLGDGYFTEYERTREFEEAVAKYLGVAHCSVVNNGTISLSLALLASGIKAGDHVIVPNITMMATCSAVRLIGAIPEFVDIDPENGCLDLNKATKLVSETCIRGVIYVTLNGRSHQLSKLLDFGRHANYHMVTVVYDNAQSFGSKDSSNYPINCFEAIGSFSFSMPKIITTGQGGCLVTNDLNLADMIRRLKDFGRAGGGNDIHPDFGINSKFTEIQAIMGLNQMKTIGERVDKKLYLDYLYRSNLSYVAGLRFLPAAYGTVPWFIDIYSNKRDDLKVFLAKRGIQTRVMYPELSQQRCNQGYGFSSMKESKIFASEGLWLPSSLDLEESDVKDICETIKEFYAN